MVDVFVVTGAHQYRVGSTQYEGEEFVGVYASLEDAQAAAESYADRAANDDRSQGNISPADFYNVYQVELGRAGRWHSNEDAVWQYVVDQPEDEE